MEDIRLQKFDPVGCAPERLEQAYILLKSAVGNQPLPTVPRPDIIAREMEYYDQWMAGKNGTYFVYTGNQGNVNALTHVSVFENTKSMHIDALAVAPERRGKGIGSVILNRLITLADEQGIDEVRLVVRCRNRARNLYENIGFKPVPEDDEFCPPPDSAFTAMILDLSNPDSSSTPSGQP